MSSMGSENSATSCPSDWPTLTYLVIVLMARAERSNLDTINSLIRSSNVMLEFPSPELTHDLIRHYFALPLLPSTPLTIAPSWPGLFQTKRVAAIPVVAGRGYCPPQRAAARQ